MGKEGVVEGAGVEDEGEEIASGVDVSEEWGGGGGG